jgi:transposase
LFTGFLGLLMNYMGKPLTVILDNASFHQAKAVQPMLKGLAQKGLKLYFLPPYSLELIRIEMFLHKVTYVIDGTQDAKCKILVDDVCKIFVGFDKDYGMTFS